MFFTQSLIVLSVSLTQSVQFVPMHTQLQFEEPVQCVFDGIQDEIVYVVEKKGVVRRVSTQQNTAKKPVYLDITDRVGVTNDEEGLLSLAFSPNYEKNGELYVWYSAQNPKRGVLSRFVFDFEKDQVQSDTEQVLLEVQQPWGNHNGGTVMFGHDGFLYLGIGDGGAANDPYRNGQNKKTLLGTVIRIDINNSTEETAYAIPKDNPFVAEENTRHEIWAWGLRNPWRMSFDKETGDLWTGDVGQNRWEEIDIITKGGNFGWNIREGKHEFQEATQMPRMIEPVHEYGRRLGGSITGGYVYRGSEIPELVGGYIYSDYLSKRIWVLAKQNKQDDTQKQFVASRIAKKSPLSISSFGETPSGEIIACGFQTPYDSVGKIYRLVPLSLSDATTSSMR